MLRPISQPFQSIFSYTLAPIQSICRNHRTAVAVFTTLFLATQAHAQANNDGASSTILDRVTDWMAQDTGLKVGAFAVVLFTAIVVCIKFRKSTPPIRTVSGEDDVRTAPKRRGAGKAPSSDPTTAHNRDKRRDQSKGILPKPYTGSDAAADKTFQQRMIEGGVNKTPGGINITPSEMRENGIAALRKAKELITPQMNALLSYTLAAHLMMLGKYKEAKDEGNTGYQYLESQKITGDIKTDLSLLIQQCRFLIAQPNTTAPHKQKRNQQVPETPGAVNRTPEQMRNKGIESLFEKFKVNQKGILFYILAADLMLEGRFLEAKEEIKIGIDFLQKEVQRGLFIQENNDLHNQYRICNQEIEKRKTAKTAHSHLNSNNGLNERPSVLKKPLPVPPQEEETDEPDVRSNAPPEEEPAFRPTSPPKAFSGAPSPPKVSFDAWEKQSKAATPAVEPKGLPLNGKVHKIDLTTLPPPPKVVLKGDSQMPLPPPPTPSKLPLPGSLPHAAELKPGRTTTKQGEKGESTQAPKSHIDELKEKMKKERGGLKPAETVIPEKAESPLNVLKQIERGPKLRRAAVTPNTHKQNRKLEIEQEEAAANPISGTLNVRRAAIVGSGDVETNWTEEDDK